jgi:hypothetical protein
MGIHLPYTIIEKYGKIGPDFIVKLIASLE